MDASLEVNNVVRKFKSENVASCDAFTDNLSDGGTQGGHLILLMGQEGRFVFFCFFSYLTVGSQRG